MARAGAAVSAAMLVLTVVAALASSEPKVSAAGTNAGVLTLVDPVSKAAIANGTATTPFEINPPNGAACTGDTATGGYRVNSYIVPASVDPSTLTWNANGPVPAATGANLRQPLFTATGSPFVTSATAATTAIINAALTSPFSFGVFTPAFVPNGAYNVGLACTLNGVEDKFWNVVLNFTTTAGTLGFTVAAGTPPPTTTTTTATTVAPGGSTTSSTSTTTTVRSTTSSSTTTTNVVLSSAGGDGGLLVSTGSSPTRLVVWAVLLLVFGRMAILLGRPIRVVSALR
jgi:hypothetical protein